MLPPLYSVCLRHEQTDHDPAMNVSNRLQANNEHCRDVPPGVDQQQLHNVCQTTFEVLALLLRYRRLTIYSVLDL